MLSPALELGVLSRVASLVALLLARLVLPIAAHVAQEGVVCEWSEKADGVEEGVCVQQQGEGKVDQCVSEVATKFGQRGGWGQ